MFQIESCVHLHRSGNLSHPDSIKCDAVPTDTPLVSTSATKCNELCNGPRSRRPWVHPPEMKSSARLLLRIHGSWKESSSCSSDRDFLSRSRAPAAPCGCAA